MDAQELTAALEKLCASDALSLDALRDLTAPLVAAATRRENATQSKKKPKGKKKGGGKKKKRRSGDAVQSYKFFHEAVGNKGVTLEIVQHLLEVFPDAASKHCSAEYCLRCINDYVDYDEWDSEVAKSGTYPLHLACCNNDCPGSVIKLLVEKHPAALEHPLGMGLYGPDDLENDSIFCDGGLPLHYYLARISKASQCERDGENISGSEGTEADKRSKSNVDHSVVKRLVDAFPRALEARNDYKETPLHTVLRNHHIVPFPTDIVKYFIANMDQSDLDAIDRYERTPLHVACTNKNISLDAITPILRCQPAALDHKDVHGLPPMHVLCYEGRSDESTCLDIAKCFIRESPECLQTESSDGRLPIHLASYNKSARFCKLLVEACPDSVRFKSVKHKELPIHMACKFGGKVETLKMLFNLYPEGMTEKTGLGLYPLHLAASYSDKESSLEKIAFLLSKDPGAASRPFRSKPYPSAFWDSNGRLPLHFACDRYEIDLASMKSLLQAYPEAMSVEDSFGRTPLITAEEKSASGSEVVSFLKEHDPSALMTYIGSYKCEACGIDDSNGRLKTCEGCHLALYCSSSCQRQCWHSHRDVCKHKSEMPPLHSSTLNLLSDTSADFKTRLQYALYMPGLKHLKISIRMERIDDLDLAAADLKSIFFHKKGWGINSLTLDFGDGCEEYARKITGHGKVLGHLYNLSTLRLKNVVFAAALDLLNLLRRQRSSLRVLHIQRLAMKPADQEGSCPWSQRVDRESFVDIWSGFGKLAKVELEDHHLDDAMLDQILSHLPMLKVLRLACRRVKGVLTNSICKSISQLGRLQALSLVGHDNVTVSTVRRILMNCSFMRELCFSGTISSLGELKSLLAMAPQLLYFAFVSDFSPDEIEWWTHSVDVHSFTLTAYGGKTTFWPCCKSFLRQPGFNTN